MRQMIGDLIRKGRGKRCLYFSFEKIQLKREPELLREIINYYLKNILEEKPYEVKKQTYFFLDEIQNIPHWAEIVKSYYDQNENFKFLVSGSNSLFVQKKSQEALAGRIIEFNLYPLCFREYLELVYPRYKVDFRNRSWLTTANLEILNSRFERYLHFGQFPEIIDQKLTPDQARQYLETVEEKIIFNDLPRIFKIAHPEILSLIVNQVKTIPGQRIEYQNVAQDAGLDQRTIAKYFGFLEKGFLVFLCRNFGKKPLKALRVARKAYLSSVNLAPKALLPLLVENYFFNFWRERGLEVYFQKDKEVDFVAVSKEGKISLSEVKYQEKIDRKDSRYLRDFLKTKKDVRAYLFTKKATTGAYLFTKKDFRKEGKIMMVPASLAEFWLSV